MSNIKADTLSTLDGTKSITTDRIAQGVARAWVNFNGTGTVAIRASFNVSSITDNGTGSYTVNFTTAMPDANYSCAASAGRLAGSAGALAELQTAYTTTSVVVTTLNTALAGADSANINVAIFR